MSAEGPGAPYLPAAREALAQFPVTPRKLATAAVSENVSFRVTTASGDAYVLRLHRPGYNTLEELESERRWRDALAAIGLRVQTALAACDGRHFVPVSTTAAGEPGGRYASMVSWLPGEILDDGRLDGADRLERQRLFRDLGALAAQLHNQAAGWRAPVGFTRPALDRDGLLGEQPRWGRFWENGGLGVDDRTLVLKARDCLRVMLDDYGAHRDNFSLIHADLHPGNVLVDADDKLGLIDFDDAAYGWHGYDLASALIEAHADDDFPALREALLTGYREVRPLAPRDEAMLPVFLLLRGLALLGWVHERPEHGEEEFFVGIRGMVVQGCARLVSEF
ncbi:phosphotransferase [Pseudohaliea sp.]|uniref:phosphotransferase enzyme family protein n=1 Tax=Pseudohaliea sp. TaxID=2740289 RepID=UPI0032EB6810